MVDKSKNKGFTLVEIMVAFSIVAILAIVSITVINPAGLIRKAHDAKRKSDLSRIKTAMEDYYNDKGCFPNENDINNVYSLKSTCGSNSFGSWLPKWPCDPKGNKYILEVETDTNGNIKTCPKWFKVYTNLENKNDSGIPKGWYSMDSLVLSGNYGVNQVNYGVSSTNINWNSVSSVDYSSLPTPTQTQTQILNSTNFSNLVIKAGKNTLLTDPTFSSSNLNYSVQLASIPVTVAIIPTIETVGATVTVNSIPVTGGVATPVLIDSSPKTILIVVTSPDHLTTKTYKIIFSSPPYLSNLVVKSGRATLTLDPSFMNNIFEYSVNANGAPGCVVIPTTNDYAVIKVNDIEVPNGIQSSVISLNIGENIVKIEVNSTKYILNVTR